MISVIAFLVDFHFLEAQTTFTPTRLLSLE
jgi:hypothetical protein